MVEKITYIKLIGTTYHRNSFGFVYLLMFLWSIELKMTSFMHL